MTSRDAGQGSIPGLAVDVARVLPPWAGVVWRVCVER